MSAGSSTTSPRAMLRMCAPLGSAARTSRLTRPRVSSVSGQARAKPVGARGEFAQARGRDDLVDRIAFAPGAAAHADDLQPDGTGDAGDFRADCAEGQRRS